MKKFNLIPYTKEHLLYLFDYDREEGKLYWKNPNPKNKRYKSLIGTEAGSISQGYRRVAIDGIRFFIHRIIYFLETGEQPVQPYEIDHEDEDKLNNRFNNLQVLKNSDNIRKQKLTKRNTSGFKGITWIEKRNKWCTSVKIKNKSIYLGSFDTKEEAAKAYDIYVITAYNKGIIENFPYLNFSIN